MANTVKSVVLMVVSLMMVLNCDIHVAGQKPYNSDKQMCCQGNVVDKVGGDNAVCCGAASSYNSATDQCCDDQKTVIPQTNDKNETLTCCAGVGLVAGYNQKCCAGKLSDQPQVTSQYDTFDCCNEKIYIANRQSCCNGVVSDDASQVLGCCNNDKSYDTTKSICCNTTVVPIPATSTQYNYECCGLDGYDVTNQICDPTTQKLYEKPTNASCADIYQQVCGGKVLNPNEQCCNDRAYRPPSVWIDDGTGSGSGYMGVVASCCGSGEGLLADNRKETCCRNGADGILPIDLPTQACCGKQIIDTTVNTCCNENILPGPSGSTGCCGPNAVDFGTQLCCGETVYEQSEGYDACCTTD